MRPAIVCMFLFANAGAAEAKYDPCRSQGAPVLIPARAVPRNAKLWLAHHDFGPVALRRRGQSLVTRYDDRFGSGVVDPGLLDAEATYEVQFHGWTFATITTSAEPDVTPPPMPVVRGFGFAHLSDPEHSVGDHPVDPDPWLRYSAPADDIAIDVDISDDTQFVELELVSIRGRLHTTMYRDDLRWLGRSACAPSLHASPGDQVCLTIRAIDLAGNASLPAMGCTTVLDRTGDTARIRQPLRDFPKPRDQPVRDWFVQFVLAALGVVAGSALIRGLRLAAAARRGVMPPSRSPDGPAE